MRIARWTPCYPRGYGGSRSEALFAPWRAVKAVVRFWHGGRATILTGGGRVNQTTFDRTWRAACPQDGGFSVYATRPSGKREAG